ncbi:N-acetylmuramoyl-L-alanine amidase [Heliorestis convoluta]|uniref:N-acetylmuramoyl-L-alanine amidase n=1 Tax=Heliorestis convoluta TaxID=356322 RepID=A0A5Q2MXK7_9FIRM|nr:N-acetylmuramoyl-L-alanine amidase [Heliorestis convoluta]QGG47358.1 peptidoglycan-binding protein LysM [Heliorestis convoluta]
MNLGLKIGTILNSKYMTNNDCFRAGRKISPKGIMIHSTATPGVRAAAWFNLWNKSYQAGETNRQVCVHAFVDDQEIWQYLPWDHRGWHAGGEANNSHIGIEICEPGGFQYAGSTMVGYDVAKQEAYFRKAWQNAVDLTAWLCRKFNLTERDVIGHAEGHRIGIASNHADPLHWFAQHKESMDSFRAAVKKALDEEQAERPLGITVGTVVAIKPGTRHYYPGGPAIPDWVIQGSYHKVTQTLSRGKPVVRGGKECVLLGKKVNKKTEAESAGIMTWIDKGALIIIVPTAKETEEREPLATKAVPEEDKTYYRVQVGAFTKRENAEALLKQLEAAGFEGYIRS